MKGKAERFCVSSHDLDHVVQHSSSSLSLSLCVGGRKRGTIVKRRMTETGQLTGQDVIRAYGIISDQSPEFGNDLKHTDTAIVEGPPIRERTQA